MRLRIAAGVRYEGRCGLRCEASDAKAPQRCEAPRYVISVISKSGNQRSESQLNEIPESWSLKCKAQMRKAAPSL
jgi:hypothetical protein